MEVPVIVDTMWAGTLCESGHNVTLLTFFKEKIYYD